MPPTKTKWRYRNHLITIDLLGPFGPYYMIHHTGAGGMSGGAGSLEAAKRLIDLHIKSLTCKHREYRIERMAGGREVARCKDCFHYFPLPKKGDAKS